MQNLKCLSRKHLAYCARACLLKAIRQISLLLCFRILRHLEMEQSGLDKYFILSELASSNQTLFYHVVMTQLEVGSVRASACDLALTPVLQQRRHHDHLVCVSQALAPVIYTPTVGEACQQFDRIYKCVRE